MTKKAEPGLASEYVPISEAASSLGVSPDELLESGAQGTIPVFTRVSVLDAEEIRTDEDMPVKADEPHAPDRNSCLEVRSEDLAQIVQQGRCSASDFGGPEDAASLHLAEAAVLTMETLYLRRDTVESMRQRVHEPSVAGASGQYDIPVIEVLLERLLKYRLPRALELKRHVDAGGTLGAHDIAFLERVFHESHNVNDVIERHPDFKPLVAKLISLYHDITSRALENEEEAERKR